MSSYFSSVKLPSLPVRSHTTAVATDEPVDRLPHHESEALSHLIALSTDAIVGAKGQLPECDVWRELNNGDHERLRDEILMRFLRYNVLSVEKAHRQILATLKWRTNSLVSTLSPNVMLGTEVCIPIAHLSTVPATGDVLLFSLGEAYERKQVNHPKQETGIAKLFEHLLYDASGPHAKRSSVVVDCTNLSVRNVDLIGLKKGIFLYTNYFPDVFYKILLINYPKFVYGVWRAVCPLLDARTKSRVIWVSNGSELVKELSPPFGMESIPDWMGGRMKTGDITLYNGRKLALSHVLTSRSGSPLSYNLSSRGGARLLCKSAMIVRGERVKVKKVSFCWGCYVMGKSVVALGDASLTTADLSLLVPPSWMNDQLISFWFEHLRIHILQNDSRVTLLLPNVAYFVALTDDEEDLKPIVSVHHLKERQLVLIPVNNAANADLQTTSAPAGTHWSLLVFHRLENRLFYLDSCPSSTNQFVAENLAERLRVMFGAQEAKYSTLSVPSQSNSYDCGAFVCLFAEKVVRRFLSGGQIATLYNPKQKLSNEIVESARQEIGKVACRIFDQQNSPNKE